MFRLQNKTRIVSTFTRAHANREPLFFAPDLASIHEHLKNVPLECLDSTQQKKTSSVRGLFHDENDQLKIGIRPGNICPIFSSPALVTLPVPVLGL